MKNWWIGLAPRERLILMVGGGFFLLFLFVTRVMQPLNEKLESAQVELQDRQELLAWLQPRAEELRSRRADGDGPKQTTIDASDLLVVADQQAKAAGLSDSIKRTNPEAGNGVRIVLEQARFDDVVQWLAQLYRQSGVEVENLAITKKDPEGYVDARVSLRAGEGIN